MRRGEIWTARRGGHDRAVVIVGHDAMTTVRQGVLVVPLSDVVPSSIVQPALADADGRPVGVALTPRVGEVSKEYLIDRRGRLGDAGVESLDVALRAVLDL